MQLNLHIQNRYTEHHPHFSCRKYSRHALSDYFCLGYRQKIIEEGRGQCGCVSSQEVIKIIRNGAVTIQLTEVEGGGVCVGADSVCIAPVVWSFSSTTAQLYATHRKGSGRRKRHLFLSAQDWGHADVAWGVCMYQATQAEWRYQSAPPPPQ